MKQIINGGIAGIVATVVLSVMMMVKSQMGVMPELDVIHMLAGMLGGGAAIGWIMHFLIGIGYGVAFHIIHNKLPTNSLITKGIILGVAGWLGMMLVLMPMVGAGLFGLNMGVMAPMMTLVLHIIFGAVLGLVYSKLN